MPLLAAGIAGGIGGLVANMTFNALDAAKDAVAMIVNGFCREVFQELPMEFAVEAQKLLSLSLEGTVG